MASGNPYASPLTEGIAAPSGTSPRRPLSFGEALAGGPKAVGAVVVVNALLQPLSAALEYWAFGYWDFPPAWLELLGGLAVLLAVSSAFALGGAALVWACRWRTSAPVLASGAAAALLLTVAWVSGALFIAHSVAGRLPGVGLPAGRDIVFVVGSFFLLLFFPMLAGTAVFARHVTRWAAPPSRQSEPSPAADG
ncbi:MAG: hypothetical protein AAGJ46_13270 [Planctomycetota bacterium]